MTNKDKVREKWPDAEISQAFALQRDGSRKWMYCVMSASKFARTRGRKGHPRVMNAGPWRFSEAKAWADAAAELN
jgi:hypothetical protein